MAAISKGMRTMEIELFLFFEKDKTKDVWQGHCPDTDTTVSAPAFQDARDMLKYTVQNKAMHDMSMLKYNAFLREHTATDDTRCIEVKTGEIVERWIFSV